MIGGRGGGWGVDWRWRVGVGCGSEVRASSMRVLICCIDTKKLAMACMHRKGTCQYWKGDGGWWGWGWGVRVGVYMSHIMSILHLNGL